MSWFSYPVGRFVRCRPKAKFWVSPEALLIRFVFADS
jgi:hypothetical protein